MLALRPKTFAVLTSLVEHAGQLVTKEALLEAVWPEAAVSDAVLKACMGELRKALGETAKAPQFIATVHRRGYRFIAPVTESTLYETATKAGSAQPPMLDSAVRRPQFSDLSPSLVVERETVFRQLHARLEQARQGRRQVIFVTGEPGIGKTTVVEAFVAQAAVEPHVLIAYGQCIEHYGAGEAYLPLLEALGQLCRGPAGARIVTLLRQQAPTWLAQMPWLLDTADRDVLQHELLGATRERMLRELAEALETLTAETPVVLVLEDLHWSDNSTLDVLAALARRREPARLLLLGSYRPGEVSVRAHPLRTLVQDLQLHRYSTEMPLALLSERAVAAYLAARFPGSQLPPALPSLIVQRTDGNALFIHSVVEHMIAQGVLVERHGRWELQGRVADVNVDVPENLRQMITWQLSRLSDQEQQVLEVASAAGVEFSTAAVAAGLQDTVEIVEERCEELARRQHLLRSVGMVEWPDGTMATRYGFRHALYQHVAYQQIGAARRVRLHQRIGARVEKAYGSRAREMAAELAVHFVRGRDYHRAVQYLQQAAENAISRHANREAITYLNRALELLHTLPETPERDQQELTLHVTLGPALTVTEGYAAVGVERVYTRARQLCQHVGESPQLFPVLVGLRRYYQVRAEYQTAIDLGERLLAIAQSEQDQALLLEAHFGLGIALYYLGDFAVSRVHCEQGIALYDALHYRSHALVYGQDPGVACHIYLALALWALGYPEQALCKSREVLTLARERGHPYSLSFALLHAAKLHMQRREGQAAQELAEVGLTLAREREFAFWVAWGTFLRGWAMAIQGDLKEGIDQMRQGLDATRATGAGVGRSGFLALLAEAYGASGQPEEGLSVLAEALVVANSSGERYYEADIYCRKGELLLALSGDHRSEAATCFHQALDVARRQRAKSWELQAAISLSRLWQQQDKREEAWQLLTEVCDWFTEGFDTADLRQARALLRN